MCNTVSDLKFEEVIRLELKTLRIQKEKCKLMSKPFSRLSRDLQKQSQ